MINFVICDDVSNITNKLDTMLENIFVKHNLNASVGLKATNSKQVLDYCTKNKVDVFFLDINLNSSVSGLDLAEQIRKTNKNAYFIFTTGHSEYVFMAYKVKTFDYIPKPFTIERLEETILRLFDDMSYSPNKYISLNKKNTFVNQNDICYIQKEGMKLIVHTENSSFETYNSFSKLQPCLSENFVRCHKSYIANIDKIQNIESNTILFTNNTSCNIGPKYKNDFMEVFKYGNLK